MQRRSAAAKQTLPLTDATAGGSEMKLRRRKRKTKRLSRSRKKQALARFFIGVTLIAVAGYTIKRRFIGSGTLPDEMKHRVLRLPLFPLTKDLASMPAAQCDDPSIVSKLSRSKLDQSLALGTAYLLNHQHPEGNFDYQFDWITQELSDEDSAVRQAGGLWGLSLILHDMMSNRDLVASSGEGEAKTMLLKQVVMGIKKGFEYFDKHSRVLTRPLSRDAEHNDDTSRLRESLEEGRITKMKYITYPGGEEGNGDGNTNDTGAQALFVLSLIDFLRAIGDRTESDLAATGLTSDEMGTYQHMLDEFLPFLVTQHTAFAYNRFYSWDRLVDAGRRAVESGIWFGQKARGANGEQGASLQMAKWWDENILAEGGFHENYNLLGKGFGDTSPYYDGESLLAMIKAAKYLGTAFVPLWPLAAGTAQRMHQRYIVEAQQNDVDSDLTKGCYQWLSMSLFELASVTFGSGKKDRFDLPIAIQGLYHPEKFGVWLIDLANWMIETHKVLIKRRNTGYSFEGIVHALAWGTHVLSASNNGNAEVSFHVLKKLHCTIHEGMAKLVSWQVGMGAEDNDENWDGISGLGGIQNAANEAPLRVDVVQHQMHATIISRRYPFRNDRSPWPWKTALEALVETSLSKNEI